jgi:hypothetical protein
MAQTKDDEPVDFDVYVARDGCRVTDAPWRIDAYGRAGPLTSSQIFILARRFELPTELLRTLATALGRVLDPDANNIFIGESGFKARQSAQDEVAYAKKQLEAMHKRLSEVVERLLSLSVEEDGDCNFDATLKSLEAGLLALKRGDRCLQSLASLSDKMLKFEPTDRRDLRDRRRDYVFGAIFQFWVDAGRPVTFTTDPITSKRRGELVFFIQAVCACLTDPPTELSGETIAKAIREKGKSYQPTPDWGKRFPTPEDLRSVLNGLDE